jgi:hypothetical protein
MSNPVARLMAEDPLVREVVRQVFGKGAMQAVPKVKALRRVAAPKPPPVPVQPAVAAPPKPPKPPEPVGKADDDAVDVEFTVPISKIDTDKQLVFGWASVSKLDGADVLDRQDDITPIEEVEPAAYAYVRSSRRGGHRHRRDDADQAVAVSEMVESVVFTPEKLERMGLPPDAVPHGWWVGYKVTDSDVWDEVKNGELTGFSVHGTGKRIPVGS